MSETPEATPLQTPEPPTPGRLPWARLGLGGVFMGLANLVPGVSGGTMVLALGLYEEFIGAFSELTRLRIRLRSLAVVAMLFGVSVLTIFGLAGVIQVAMERALPLMLSLFIGMTLGGVPLLYREMRPLRPAGVVFALLGLGLMAWLAFGADPSLADPGWLYLFVGGVVGSSAMILPGISGSYMLLIMGLYLPIIAGIGDFKAALGAGDLERLLAVGAGLVLPVGLGLVGGLVVLSNLLRYLLERHHRRTIGFLMGLLLGSVLGLYPFQEPGFSKLPRYAVETEGGARELRVAPYGWEATPDSVIYRKLCELEGGGLALSIEPGAPGRGPNAEEIERARGRGALLLCYDVAVPRERREQAAEERQGDEVELLVVANTEYATWKAWAGLGLILLGFSITFGLGRLGGEKPARPEPGAAA